MKLGDKIPIELSEVRATRIARGLFDKLDEEERRDVRRARHPATAALLAAIALAACVALFYGVRTHTAAIEPRVAAVPARAPTEADPSRIVTGDKSSHLVFGDVTLDVASQSALVTTGDDDRGMLVVLDRGSVTCEVAPRGGRPALVVQAGGVRVRVVGTRFTVTREGDDARVTVTHGTVEVSSGEVSSFVHAGESWPPGLRPESGQGGAPAQPVGGGRVVDAPAAPSPDSVAHRRRAGGGTAALSVGSRAVSAAPVGTDVATPMIAENPQEPEANAAAPSARVADAAPLSPRAPSPQELFEQAAELEGRDAGRAIAIYEGLAEGHSSWAPNALFAEASLEQVRGRTQRARALLERYVALYPKGQNSQDAHTMLERLK